MRLLKHTFSCPIMDIDKSVMNYGDLAYLVENRKLHLSATSRLISPICKKNLVELFTRDGQKVLSFLLALLNIQ